ncbi:MAG: hypothetical protein QM755_09750 [Luteolibacter sp.]
MKASSPARRPSGQFSLTIHQLTFPAQAVTILQDGRTVGQKPDTQARTVSQTAIRAVARTHQAVEPRALV